MFLPILRAQAIAVLLFLLHHHLTSSQSTRSLRIATVTDVHIGESCDGKLTLEGCPPMKALSLAFQKMNELALDGVFLTGDLTSSALLEEYQALRDLLDELTIPWWPLLGNHDVWPYELHEDNSFNQTDTPIGDAYLAETFGDVLAAKYKDAPFAALYANSSTTDWPQTSCLNGYYKTFNSWFHNFKVEFPLFSDQLAFLALDWNARGAALPEPGVGPEAELHDFECGTLHWLDDELSKIKSSRSDSRIFIMQHHPFHNLASLDPFGQNRLFNFTFDDYQDKAVQDVFEKYFSSTAFLGVHAGHMHRWYNGSAFTKMTSIDETWCSIPEWETPASKGWRVDSSFVSSFSVFHFEADLNGNDVHLVNVTGLWRVPHKDSGEYTWEVKPSVQNVLRR